MTPEIAAEAAVWVARLHGPDRSSSMERELREWQSRSEAHRHAFERCTDTWMSVANLTLSDAFAAMDKQRSEPALRRPRAFRRRTGWLISVAALSVLVAGAVAFHLWHDADRFATDVGEQRVVVLADGTRVSLNTLTSLRVRLADVQRTVDIQGGEALFEVAKDPRRPFVVRAGGTEIVAEGTVFAVRLTSDAMRNDRALAVTLLEGRVAVRPAVGSDQGPRPASTMVLQPGERLRVGAPAKPPVESGASQVDRPSIEQVVAWRRGEAVFLDASLTDAVAEMNRYSRTPIVLKDGARLPNELVSGQFRTGDNLAFAQALARLHGLRLSEGDGRLELAPPN